MSYYFFKKVDGSSKLGRFFNEVFKKIDTARTLSAPSIHMKANEDTEGVHIGQGMIVKSAILFYKICQIELYFHAVINGLENWINILAQYNGEFESNWSYYAGSRRVDCIDRYGGEEEDYEPDGSIKVDVDDDKLTSYTIVHDLLGAGLIDIFTQTPIEGICDFAWLIANSARIDTNDIFQKVSGKRLKTYRRENGKMVENTFSDEVIQKLEKEESYCHAANTLIAVGIEIISLVTCIRELDEKKDNKSFFYTYLPERIQDILNLRVDTPDDFPLTPEMVYNESGKDIEINKRES
jgi:hypothetical protein